MLDIEERSGVAVLRLRHGKVNALDLELVRAITAAMAAVAADRAVVLTGAGSAFSAGVDLRRIVDGGEPYVREFLPALSEMFMSVFCHPGPVLAAVNGHAIAGGAVIAAACDVRVMSQGTIGFAELSVGVPFPPEGMEVLRHAIGPAASRLALTAALLDLLAAQSVGLIDDVELPDALLDSVLARAQSMLRTPAEVFSFTKRQLQQPALDRIAARKDDAKAVADMWASPRTLEAIAAYLDALAKRPGKTR
jgi:enoyl-CoA hydratase